MKRYLRKEEKKKKGSRKGGGGDNPNIFYQLKSTNLFIT